MAGNTTRRRRRARLAGAFITVTALVSPPTASADVPPSQAANPDPGSQLDAHHEPPLQAPVDTPLPLYVEVPEGRPEWTVTLHYKPFGSAKYSKLPMKRMERGFGVMIPCEDIATTGTLEYYFTLEDDSSVASTLGSQQDPFVVPMVNEVDGDPPRFPGKREPRRCSHANPPPVGWPTRSGGCAACSLAETDTEGVPLELMTVVMIAAASRARALRRRRRRSSISS